MGQGIGVWVSLEMPRPNQQIPLGDTGGRARSLDVKPFFLCS